MSTKKIFVDLDGVLINFVSGVFNKYGVPLKSEKDYPKGIRWDICKAVNVRRKEADLPLLDETSFWEGLSYHFWMSLKLYPRALAFVKNLKQYGEVYYATSPTLSSECVAGKYDYFASVFNRDRRRLIITPAKASLAQPGAILIDDRYKNCAKFIEAGGDAILFPRPWNQGGFHPDPYVHVMKEVIRWSC